jgi:(p)ppGpp synthase/HD superfamily hydrolase
MSLLTDPQPHLVMLAQALATGAHAGQEDKAKRPYIAHPARVAARVQRYGPEFMAVAWLHDVLEDTKLTAEDLLSLGLPRQVVDGVVSLTKLQGEDHSAAVTRASENPLGLVVKAADVADNSDGERLALLDGELAGRLEAKYKTARLILNEYGAPSFD